jgi:hypothetical protein
VADVKRTDNWKREREREEKKLKGNGSIELDENKDMGTE